MKKQLNPALKNTFHKFFDIFDRKSRNRIYVKVSLFRNCYRLMPKYCIQCCPFVLAYGQTLFGTWYLFVSAQIQT